MTYNSNQKCDSIEDEVIFEKSIIDLDKMPLALKVVDVAMILDISKQKAYELFNNKNFPSIRIGKRKLLITRPAFQRWLTNPSLERS